MFPISHAALYSMATVSPQNVYEIYIYKQNLVSSFATASLPPSDVPSWLTLLLVVVIVRIFHVVVDHVLLQKVKVAHDTPINKTGHEVCPSSMSLDILRAVCFHTVRNWSSKDEGDHEEVKVPKAPSIAVINERLNIGQRTRVAGPLANKAQQIEFFRKLAIVILLRHIARSEDDQCSDTTQHGGRLHGPCTCVCAHLNNDIAVVFESNPKLGVWAKQAHESASQKGSSCSATRDAHGARCGCHARHDMIRRRGTRTDWTRTPTDRSLVGQTLAFCSMDVVAELDFPVFVVDIEASKQSKQRAQSKGETKKTNTKQEQVMASVVEVYVL